jgi:hypothetical protein
LVENVPYIRTCCGPGTLLGNGLQGIEMGLPAFTPLFAVAVAVDTLQGVNQEEERRLKNGLDVIGSGRA